MSEKELLVAISDMMDKKFNTLDDKLDSTKQELIARMDEMEKKIS